MLFTSEEMRLIVERLNAPVTLPPAQMQPYLQLLNGIFTKFNALNEPNPEQPKGE